ncbi:MAG: sensor histidine kinase [Chloroflexota bacterium]
MRWANHVFAARPTRALLEAVILGAGLLLGVASLRAEMPSAALTRGLALAACVGPAVAALRLRMAPGGWRRGLLEDMFFAVVLTAGIGLLALGLGSAFGLHSDLTTALGGTLPTLFLLTATGFLYLGFRLGARAWHFWDRLRKSRLLWGLTHAHLLVVVVIIAGTVVLATIVSGAGLPAGEPAPRGSVAYTVSLVSSWLFPVVWTVALLGIIAVGLLLPPSVLVSYFVARRATARLETLARATLQLRGGAYDVRVPVQGEDEVAQLQGDFNAMAADLERARAELAAERDRVTALLESRRQLVASVSHELRTPVATIRAYLEATLQQHLPEQPPTLRRDLEIVEGEAARLQALIDDLFVLSRAEVGQLTLHCLPTDVGPLARRVADTWAPLAWRAGRVKVVAEISGEAPPALVDGGRLEQVLANLVCNAVRHTPPGGIIAVLALPGEDGDVVLEVRDTGEGIAPADLPHVFERFYRGERQPGPEDGSTGLGLALVKELTEAMGGSVAVASKPGEGSTFTLHLPPA